MKAVVDRIVQYANRYQLTNVETGEVLGTFDFDEVTGTVQQVGTEIDAELFQSIADDLAARVKLSGGELAGTIVTFSDISGTAANVASGDTSATLWGKVKNWFSRLKALAFKNKVAAGDFEAGAIKNADVAADAAIAQSKVSGLENALDAKANDADLATIAKTGNLSDAAEDATHRVVTDTEKATWNAKQNAIMGAASTIASQNLTASRALVSNAQGKVAISAVTAKELGYLDGVTSNIQTQLDDIESGTTVVGRAKNVTSQINGHAISDIFESDGVTVKRASADEDGNNIPNTYARKNGTYQNLMAGGVQAELLANNSSLNSCIPDGIGMWKMWYVSTDGNAQTITDKPTEVTTAFKVEAIKIHEVTGGARVVQRLNDMHSNEFARYGTENGSGGTNFQAWKEIVTSDGNYSTLGAGHLQHQGISSTSSSTIGWYKVGTTSASKIVEGNGSVSVIFLVNGVYQIESTATPTRSGLLELDVTKLNGNFTEFTISVLGGALDPEQFFGVLENNVVTLYWRNVSTYGKVDFTILTQQDETLGNWSDLFEFDTAFYGTSAPDNAVYATVRNNASADEDGNNIVATYAKQNGNYPTLGAGHLSRSIFVGNQNNNGWYKFATWTHSGTASQLVSTIFLVNGVNSSYVENSGHIQLDSYIGANAATAVIQNFNAMDGNINLSAFCAVVNGKNIDLYTHLQPYRSYNITIIDECGSNGNQVNEIQFSNTFYGTTAPSGAVYAVNRNVAAKGVTPATDSDSDDVATTEWVIDKLPRLYRHNISFTGRGAYLVYYRIALDGTVTINNAGNSNNYNWNITLDTTDSTPFTSISGIRSYFGRNVFLTLVQSILENSLSSFTPFSGLIDSSNDLKVQGYYISGDSSTGITIGNVNGTLSTITNFTDNVVEI